MCLFPLAIAGFWAYGNQVRLPANESKFPDYAPPFYWTDH